MLKRMKVVIEQGKNCLGLGKVIGFNWNIEKDLFVFDFDEII